MLMIPLHLNGSPSSFRSDLTFEYIDVTEKYIAGDWHRFTFLQVCKALPVWRSNLEFGMYRFSYSPTPNARLDGEWQVVRGNKLGVVGPYL